MASKMDVDPPSSGDGKTTIEFHPLAIVHMSDQYTRIKTGGSTIPKNDPVVGLLFGTKGQATLAARNHDNKLSTHCLHILDANDCLAGTTTETMDPMTAQQVSLHQAVFSQHIVLGWYRVSETDQVTAHDLVMTQRLQQHFAEPDFLFCHCQVGGDADSLPITLYQVQDNVLIAVEEWKLNTSTPEKLAVEKVLRDQPRVQERQEKDANNANDGGIATSSAYVHHMTTLQQALAKLQDRLLILTQFLRDTMEERIPFNPSLVRQVQGVVCQLGPIVACTDSESQGKNKSVDNDWLTHIALTAKTVQTVQVYTEKFRELQDYRGYNQRTRF